MKFDAKVAHDTIINWGKDWFKDKNGPAVLGISGGKDSLISAALLAEAIGPENVIGVQMPNGVQADISDSDRVFEVTGIKKVTINIGPAYEALTKEMRSASENGEEFPNSLYSTNTPARIRMTTLYGVAALNHGFVCNTCNLSEDYVGYSTKFGDSAGDFSLLNKLTVTEVLQIGDYMGLPKELVHKAPSDGMCGKTDEDNLGFTYESLDKYIREGLPFKSLEVQHKVVKMHNNINTHYKLHPMAEILEFTDLPVFEELTLV
jgi:NAD+ synthase